MRAVSTFCTFALLSLLEYSGTPLRAQAPGTGAITGTIYDSSGSLVQQAQVALKSESTGAVRATFSNAFGVFTFSLLPPGSYAASVKAPGFSEAVAQGISVVVSERSAVDFHLSISRANDTVTVEPAVELAQSESSALGRAVDRETIEALPLSNRNYTQILSLSPGVVVELPNAGALGRGTQNVAANGNKTTGDNIQFNGVDANNLSQNSAANDGEEVGVAAPAPDTLQEFKVQTGNYDASYGRGTGANVDVISKTGTMHYHGSAWEFLRNDLLNANNFFSKLTNQPRAVLKQNQFGASFGGPFRHDTLFFFGAYQGLRSSNGLGDQVTVNLPQLTSDRSAQTLGAQFCAYATAAGGTQVACDGSNINPVALALLNFKLQNGQYAIPNPQILLPSTDPTQMPIGESTFATPARYDEDQFTLNVDARPADRNQFAARFFYSHAPTIEPFSPNAANVPGWGTTELDQNTMLVLSDTHEFNPHFVNVARFGFMRFDGDSVVANPILASDLGTTSPTGTAGGRIPAPGITIDGLFTVGDAGTPSQWQVTNSFILQDTLSFSWNRHSLRFGAEFKRHQVDVNAPFSTDGLLDIRTFSDFLLGQSAEQNGSPTGSSNVSLSNGSSGLFRKDERYIDLAGFLQDDFRISNRLMLNAGLRYEVFGAPSDVNGRLVTFDPTIATRSASAEGTLSGFVVPSNFKRAVPDGVVRSSIPGLFPTRHVDFQPRLGFALRLDEHPEIVIRGGYGLYFDRLSAGLAESLLAVEPFSTFQFFAGSTNGGATLQDPFVPQLPPNSTYPTFLPRVPGAGPSLSAVARHMVDPYTAEYNLNAQIAFARDYLLEIGYVGTHSFHESGCTEFNQALLASPANPINGETTNSAINVIQRLPFAGISPGSLLCESSFNANYNSLQTSITKKLGYGLEFLGSYTWSRNLDQTSGSSGSNVFEQHLVTNDQTNFRQAYGPTDFDRTHRAVLSLVYNTAFARRLPRFAAGVVGDWRVSAVGVLQSGTPITILDDSAGAVYGNFPFENRAQLSGAAKPATSGSLFSRVLNGYLNPAAFTSAPEAPNSTGPGDTDFGDSGEGLVRGPGQRNLDMAFERAIPISDSQSVHMRAEFFNLTNTAHFNNPVNNVSAGPAFGVITSTSSNPRIIQLAVKYEF
ncbi:TonB-dependent receptor [Occallatibacter savannae]|uniref:TonB-dependent receptor n=1 Tax=Occallatibacter savannae TaxID=1002691 RepID=UPI000D68B575|nr:TonB-dependent receptor [Occallatibacter savannae]